jgi:beta-galactosidase
MQKHISEKISFALLLTMALPTVPGILWADDSGRVIYKEVFAPGDGFVNKYEKTHRREICLNGFWEFQGIPLPPSYKQGEGIAPELPEPQNDAWDKTRIKIPSPWNINSFAFRDLAGPDHRNYPSYPQAWESVKMAWMRKTVAVPADWEGKTIKLYFEAVAGYTEVYINGNKVAENFDLFLPFEADITQYAAAGQTLEVLVGVRSQSLFEDNSTVGRRVVPAGSMWGSHIAGVWQDVFLYAVPAIHIEDVFVKPLVSAGVLELEVSVRNHTGKKMALSLAGEIRQWINNAGNEINSAPVPNWELGNIALAVPDSKLTSEPQRTTTVTIQIPVKENVLQYWTPDNPRLYGLLLSLKAGKNTADTKYERFGWREWSIEGTRHCLNGQPFELRGDSWHFMGIPQMTRRYAWAWFTALKNTNANAVRPHAQVYPRFYLDVADEMGICVMNETAIWASDGGPKMDALVFWDTCKEHIRRFVLRDRNHASVFGWSVSNENKPVINHVFNKPELMIPQKQAWKDWLDIVRTTDPTRPWVSSDGEDDGEGILPVTVGHYGDVNSMKRWVNIGKPWGIGEHSMAYYGTPEQVSKYNGQRAYESQEGRMEGLANECYNLITNQRKLGASYVSTFNIAWYALKPLPLGKRNLTTVPSLTDDGIFFTDYVEGVQGVQPERIGSYCTTFNPGYDPNLPLYETWPMYDAIRAANAPDAPAWSKWATVARETKESDVERPKQYTSMVFIGEEGSNLKGILNRQGVIFSDRVKMPDSSLYIIDGSTALNTVDLKLLSQDAARGADLFIWGIIPSTLESYRSLLPLPLALEDRKISSFLPENKSWTRGLNNVDFYFCELQTSDASLYGLSGKLAEESEILLNACRTDWRKWNKRPEEIKTAATLRSESEAKGAAPAIIKYNNGNSTVYVGTLTEFANSEKGFNTLAKMLKNAGIPCQAPETSTENVFFLRDGVVQFPVNAKTKFVKGKTVGMLDIEFWIWSPRPLDDLLIEPDMPKLDLFVFARESALLVNNIRMEKFTHTNRECTFTELPLQQGWNQLILSVGGKDRNDFRASLNCNNRDGFLPLLKVAYKNPEHN